MKYVEMSSYVKDRVVEIVDFRVIKRFPGLGACGMREQCGAVRLERKVGSPQTTLRAVGSHGMI